MGVYELLQGSYTLFFVLKMENPQGNVVCSSFSPEIILSNVLVYSLFHIAGFVSHTVKYISHTVVFVFHSVKQRIYPEVWKNE